MVRFAITVAALCLAVAWPTISHAQFYDQEAGPTGPSLQGDDFALMHAAALRLYRRDVVADGAATQWSNPKTGDSGTITALQSFQQSGMACRKVRYEIRLRGNTANNIYTVNWCKTASGEWKILS
jgi:surface antigen